MSEQNTTSSTPQELIDSFIRVTEKIDSLDYADISQFWIDRHNENGSMRTAPVIILDTDHLEQLGAHGRCAEKDPVIMIHPRVLQWAPIGIDSLLAHELAHILHFARGQVKPNTDDEEEQAKATMLRWGYENEMVTICNEQAKNFPNESLEEVRERIRLYRLQFPEHE